MGMKSSNSKQIQSGTRRFNDERERTAVINRTIVIGYTIFLTVIILFTRLLFTETAGGGLNRIVVAASILLVIANWVFYLSNKASLNYHRFVIITYLMLYTLGMLFCKFEYLQYSILGIYIMTVLFYRDKEMRLYIAATAGVNIIYFIMLYHDTIRDSEMDTFSELSAGEQLIVWAAFAKLVFLLCVLYTAIRSTDRGKLFNEDMVGTVTDQKQGQQEMLEAVLEIAGNIRENTAKSSRIVDELGGSTSIVNTAIGQIAASTQLTAENIQEQNIMTRAIQEAINVTVQRSRRMVDIADESSVSIDGSRKVMDELRTKSESIAGTNQSMVQCINELSLRMQEVRDIAAIIFGISNQTNLLALNASIESARAGEAGKGFAVVADQIRKLAGQTKKSTENIANILEELKQNVDQVNLTVDETINASNDQGTLISDALEQFDKISGNVHLLSDDIDGIDHMLQELAGSNRTIVENIGQISATTEEVTASTQEATAISEKNLQISREAIKLLGEVIDTTHRLDKYIS